MDINDYSPESLQELHGLADEYFEHDVPSVMTDLDHDWNIDQCPNCGEVINSEDCRMKCQANLYTDGTVFDSTINHNQKPKIMKYQVVITSLVLHLLALISLVVLSFVHPEHAIYVIPAALIYIDISLLLTAMYKKQYDG